MEKIEYFLDEEKIAEKKPGKGEPGNNFNLEDFALPKEFSGEATIRVILTDKLGLTATAEVLINVVGANGIRP